jgi:hypothetical protein
MSKTFLTLRKNESLEFSKTFLRLAAVGSAHINSSRVTLLLLFTIDGRSAINN